MLLFQPFGEDSSSPILLFYLFLGFCGFFLLVFLLTNFFLSISEKDQPIIDAEEITEIENDTENYEKGIKSANQLKMNQNLFLKIKRIKSNVSEIITNVLRLPLIVYSYSLQWKVEIDNDFISMP